MIKILLFLAVFTPANGWQKVTDDPPQQFRSIADCMAAAQTFLEHANQGISKDVPAIGAECVVGNDEF